MHTKSRARRVHTILDAGLLEQTLHLRDFLGDGGRWRSEGNQAKVSITTTHQHKSFKDKDLFCWHTGSTRCRRGQLGRFDV